MEKLRLTAEAAGPDASAGSEILQRAAGPRNQAIARVFAPGDGREGEAARNHGGNVLHAVNGEVDGPSQQRILELFDENPLRAGFPADHFVDLSDRRGLQMVTGGANANNFGFDAVELL